MWHRDGEVEKERPIFVLINKCQPSFGNPVQVMHGQFPRSISIWIVVIDCSGIVKSALLDCLADQLLIRLKLSMDGRIGIAAGHDSRTLPRPVGIARQLAPPAGADDANTQIVEHSSVPFQVFVFAPHRGYDGRQR